MTQDSAKKSGLKPVISKWATWSPGLEPLLQYTGASFVCGGPSLNLPLWVQYPGASKADQVDAPKVPKGTACPMGNSSRIFNVFSILGARSLGFSGPKLGFCTSTFGCGGPSLNLPLWAQCHFHLHLDLHLHLHLQAPDAQQTKTQNQNQQPKPKTKTKNQNQKKKKKKQNQKPKPETKKTKKQKPKTKNTKPKNKTRWCVAGNSRYESI